MNQRANLLPDGRSQRLEFSFQVSGVKLRCIERSQTHAQLSEMSQPLGGEDFLHRSFFKFKILAEEIAHPFRQFTAQLDLFLHDGKCGPEISGIVTLRKHAAFLQNFHRQGFQCLDACRAEILAVNPEKFVEIKVGIGAIDLRQIKLGDDFLNRQHLAVVLGRPAKQAKIIPHRLMQVALLLVIGNGGTDITLAHLGTVRIQDERDMCVMGSLCAEGLNQRQMLVRIGKVIFTADDMGHVHLDIIHHVDQMENGRAILALDHEIGLVGTIDLPVSADQIRDVDGCLGHAKADRAVGLVGLALGKKPVDIFLVDFAPLALKVRPFIAFDTTVGLWALIRIHAEPFQTLKDDIDILRLVAGGIGILNAEDKSPAGVAGIKPVEEGSAGTANVKHPRGGGGKTDADGFHFGI